MGPTSARPTSGIMSSRVDCRWPGSRGYVAGLPGSPSPARADTSQFGPPPAGQAFHHLVPALAILIVCIGPLGTFGFQTAVRWPGVASLTRSVRAPPRSPSPAPPAETRTGPCLPGTRCRRLCRSDRAGRAGRRMRSRSRRRSRRPPPASGSSSRSRSSRLRLRVLHRSSDRRT